MDDSVPQDTPIKHCPRCNRDLPATSEYFGRQSKPKDGFRYICRECRHNIYLADLARNPNFNKEMSARQRASLESKSPEEQAEIRARRAQTKHAYNKKRIKKDGYCNTCKAHPCEPGYLECEKCRSYDVQWKKVNHDKFLLQKKARRDKLREQVLNAYGNKCMCCGEFRPEFLAVDHVNNDGRDYRRVTGHSGHRLYEWLRKNNFPKDGIQLLCANCNWGKHACGGICLHQGGVVSPVDPKNHAQQWRYTLRQEVLAAYGNKCICCDEEHVPFLTIDHINGNRNTHRRAIGGQAYFYPWLRKNNFPHGYQILCRNCNFAKYVYGVCPHQKPAPS